MYEKRTDVLCLVVEGDTWMRGAMCMQHAWHVECNKGLLDYSSGMTLPRTCSRRK